MFHKESLFQVIVPAFLFFMVTSFSHASSVDLLGIQVDGFAHQETLQARTTLSSPWVTIEQAVDLRALTVLADGRILGAFSNQDLSDPWTHTLRIKNTLYSDWKLVSRDNQQFIHSIAVMADGKIVGVGTDSYIGGGIGTNYALWTKETLTSPWVLVPNSNGAISISVMTDGRILGVGKSLGLWVRNSLRSSWVAVPDSGDVISVAAMDDGSIIGVGKSKGLWVRTGLTSPWKAVTNSGKISSVTNGRGTTVKNGRDTTTLSIQSINSYLLFSESD